MRRTPEPHKSSRQALKAADIDLAIQPVVAWLNSFETVLTQHSCEGRCVQDRDAHGGYIDGPYVIFYCHDPFELVSVFRVLESACGSGSYRVGVEWWGGSLRYVLRLNDKDALGALVALIRAERLGAAGGR